MKKKTDNIIKDLENKIAQGNLEAMFDYAEIYQYNRQNEITDEIAAKMVNYYEICIEDGNLNAALNLGSMYYIGEIIPRDYKKAFKYYKLATESEDDEISTDAWCCLGYCYYYGRDIPVDDEQAFNCYMHGVLENDANCLYKLGDMYRYGRFVKKDEKLAFSFYKRAKNFVSKYNYSYPDVCRRLGECKLYGLGTEKDIIEAVNYLSKAEIYTYKKIKQKDPFAASLLPEIQKMLAEAKKLLEEDCT